MKHRPHFLIFTLAFSWLIINSIEIYSTQIHADSIPPNIIFILADDLGYGEVGFNGQKKIKTPHLDQMAKDGAIMTQFYAGAPVCGPSRATLFYGQHTGHAPIRGNPKWTKSGKAVEMKADDVTLVTELKRAGYSTGMFGKWGMNENLKTNIGHPLNKDSMSSLASTLTEKPIITGQILYGMAIKNESEQRS